MKNLNLLPTITTNTKVKAKNPDCPEKENINK